MMPCENGYRPNVNIHFMQVLSYLDDKTLRRLCLVSCTWKALITTTDSLWIPYCIAMESPFLFDAVSRRTRILHHSASRRLQATSHAQYLSHKTTYHGIATHGHIELPDKEVPSRLKLDRYAHKGLSEHAAARCLVTFSSPVPYSWAQRSDHHPINNYFAIGFYHKVVRPLKTYNEICSHLISSCHHPCSLPPHPLCILIYGFISSRIPCAAG